MDLLVTYDAVNIDGVRFAPDNGLTSQFLWKNHLTMFEKVARRSWKPHQIGSISRPSHENFDEFAGFDWIFDQSQRNRFAVDGAYIIAYLSLQSYQSKEARLVGHKKLGNNTQSDRRSDQPGVSEPVRFRNSVAA